MMLGLVPWLCFRRSSFDTMTRARVVFFRRYRVTFLFGRPYVGYVVRLPYPNPNRTNNHERYDVVGTVTEP